MKKMTLLNAMLKICMEKHAEELKLISRGKPKLF